MCTRSWYLAIGLISHIRKKDAEEPNDSVIEQGLCTANIIHGDHTSGKPWKIEESSFPYWKVCECPLFCLKSWFCPWLSWKFQIIIRFDKLQLLQQCFVKICCPRIESNQLICTVNQLIDFYMRATYFCNTLLQQLNIGKMYNYLKFPRQTQNKIFKQNRRHSCELQVSVKSFQSICHSNSQPFVIFFQRGSEIIQYSSRKNYIWWSLLVVKLLRIKK